MSSGDAGDRPEDLHIRANGGIKFDLNKLDWTLLPWKEVEDVVKILDLGAKKYAKDNWKKLDTDTYKKALARHMASYLGGELNDKESGLSHCAHIACNALFLMWHEKNNASKEEIVTLSSLRGQFQEYDHFDRQIELP
jgi:hypothetical protein